MDRSSKKTILRTRLLTLRRALKPVAILEKSRKITEKILVQKNLPGKDRILIYLPIGSEVDTLGLIKYFFKTKKRLFLPSYKKEWHMREFKNFENLEDGPYGTRQPNGTRVKIDDIDLSILPAVAFTKGGARLGYGRGVYDKLLATSASYKLGLCFDFQIVDEDFEEIHDLKMDAIVTEKRVIRFV
jgi:5-formyltetrahydrofolate cyclo-ligase